MEIIILNKIIVFYCVLIVLFLKSWKKNVWNKIAAHFQGEYLCSLQKILNCEYLKWA